MSGHRATATAGTIFIDEGSRSSQTLTQFLGKYLDLIADNFEHGLASSDAVRIEPYIPFVAAANGWLPLVEERIRLSVLPGEYEADERANEGEWLSVDTANAAISFFRNGADFLPTEPHIYASRSGDLVAEFETPDGSITAVVSAERALLFAVMSARSDEPVEALIPRGSSHFRDELRSFFKKLAASPHGQMDATE